MARNRKKWSLISLVAALLCWVGWQFSPGPAIQAISSLSDPAKLATLGERGANSRLNKIVYWMHEAENGGLSAGKAVAIAQWLNGTSSPRAELVRASLERNLVIARELGLLTKANVEALRHGKAATVTRGPYANEAVEIDHIVPYSLAPEVGNELANLEMLPRTLNRKKSNRVGSRQIARAEKLYAAGLLTTESLAKVRAQANTVTVSPKNR